MSTALGNHILVEFMNCEPHIMNDVVAIERDMVGAAQKAGATVINSTFHHFSPYGVSGVVVIQEVIWLFIRGLNTAMQQLIYLHVEN